MLFRSLPDKGTKGASLGLVGTVELIVVLELGLASLALIKTHTCSFISENSETLFDCLGLIVGVGKARPDGKRTRVRIERGEQPSYEGEMSGELGRATTGERKKVDDEEV